MPDEPVITDSYGPDMFVVYEAINLMAEMIHRIDHRTAVMDAELGKLREAFSTGGLRGFRQAIKAGGNGDGRTD